MASTPVIGFVGFGEAGYNLAKGLLSEGLTGIIAYDIASRNHVRSQVIRDRAADARVRLLESNAAVTSSADIVVLAVPAQDTLSAGLTSLESMHEGQLFVDVTTASPKHKAALGEAFAKKGVSYVDSAMMGALPVSQHKVPMLACGAGAAVWHETMAPYSMQIEVLEGSPGRATQIKLTRSIFMKGVEALLLETFLAAKKCGIEDVIMASIAETMDECDFRTSAKRLITGDAIHSKRRAHEAHESARLLDELGIEPLMTRGTAARLDWSASLGLADRFKGVTPRSIDEVYQAWRELGLL